MKTIRDLQIGSLVYDKVTHEYVEIGNLNDLEYVAKLLSNRFKGIRITQNNIMNIFSDFIIEPTYCTGLKIKYRFFKLRNQIQPIRTTIVFYGCMNSRIGQYFWKSDIFGDDLVGSFSDGNDPFHYVYCIRDSTKLNLKYIHEMQNLLCF